MQHSATAFGILDHGFLNRCGSYLSNRYACNTGCVVHEIAWLHPGLATVWEPMYQGRVLLIADGEVKGLF